MLSAEDVEGRPVMRLSVGKHGLEVASWDFP